MTRNFWKLSDIAPPLSDLRRVHRDIFGGGGDSPPPPDYSKVSEASEKSAVLAKELGDAQLAEGKRQFDRTLAVAEPIVREQTASMREGTTQARDYYNRGKAYRTYEDAMAASAFGVSPADMAKVGGMRRAAQTAARGAFDTKAGLRRDASLKQQALDEQAARLAAQNQATQTSTATGPSGGFIRVNGIDYAPNEIRNALTPAPSGEMGGNTAPTRFNPELDRIHPDEIRQAAKDAGYDVVPGQGGNYELRRTGSSSTAATAAASGTTSDVRQSDGFPMQRPAPYDAEFDPATADESDANAYLSDVANKAQAEHDARIMEATDPSKIDAYMASQMPENERTAAGIQTAYDKLQGSYGNLQGAQTAGNQTVYDQNTGDIEFGVGNAVADARSGYSGAVNQAIRQGMRYGFSPARLSKTIGSGALGSASQVAAAANTARAQGIEGARGRMIAGAGTGVTAAGANVNAAGAARDMQQQNSGYGLQRVTGKRNLAIQDDSIRRAKQLDVVGMARGMPGASTGAYGVANAAGNSAVQNTMAPSNSYLQNISAANGTIMQGQGMQIQGLSSAANGQASAYNVAQQNSGGGMGSMLGMGKAGMDIAMGAKALGWIGSDRRLKENITLVGDGPHGVGLYEFNYIGDDKRMRGVMADEVESVMPDAVTYDDLGFAAVNYPMLGIEMVEV